MSLSKTASTRAKAPAPEYYSFRDVKSFSRISEQPHETKQIKNDSISLADEAVFLGQNTHTHTFSLQTPTHPYP